MNALGDDIRNATVSWAESVPRVRRVWVFGSRAEGKPRPDSDIDIAVELEPVVDSEEALPYWIAYSEKWQSQLQRELAYPVDLDWFDPDGSTPRIQAALDKGAILVYERALEDTTPH
jgi:uncharacterized protein